MAYNNQAEQGSGGPLNANGIRPGFAYDPWVGYQSPANAANQTANSFAPTNSGMAYNPFAGYTNPNASTQTTTPTQQTQSVGNPNNPLTAANSFAPTNSAGAWNPWAGYDAPWMHQQTTPATQTTPTIGTPSTGVQPSVGMQPGLFGSTPQVHPQTYAANSGATVNMNPYNRGNPTGDPYNRGSLLQQTQLPSGLPTQNPVYGTGGGSPLPQQQNHFWTGPLATTGTQPPLNNPTGRGIIGAQNPSMWTGPLAVTSTQPVANNPAGRGQY